MAYRVKELFHTLQGEGANTGRAATFIRFSGCNLWSGRDDDRARAICSFCDTDFVGTDGEGGGSFATAELLAAAASRVWSASGADDDRRFVVCTGGEPLLQLDAEAVAALHEAGFEVAVETNGTRAVPDGVDWLCVSPKAGAVLVLARADELKLVFPQPGAEPERYTDFDAGLRYLSPMDGPDLVANMGAAAEYCRSNPVWRLTIQVHKVVGIP